MHHICTVVSELWVSSSLSNALNFVVVVVVVVALLFYVHGKHLGSCRNGQLT